MNVANYIYSLFFCISLSLAKNIEVDLKRAISIGSSVVSASCHPNKHFVCVGSTAGYIKVYSYKNNGVSSELYIGRTITCLDWLDGSKLSKKASDDSFIVVGCQSGLLFLCKFSSSKKDLTFYKALSGHTNHIRDIKFSPDNTKIASCACDKRIIIWDSASGSQLCCLFEGAGVNKIEWIDDTLLAIGCDGGKVFIFNITTQEIQCSLNEHFNHISFLISDKNKNFLAIGSCDKSFSLWNLQTLTCKKHVKGLGEIVKKIFIDEDNLFVALYNGEIRIYSISSGNLIHVFFNNSNLIDFDFFSNKYVVACDNVGNTLFFNILTKEKILSLNVGANLIQRVLLSYDSKYLITLIYGGRLISWRLKNF